MVYTGGGKGKTTAALGAAVRAAGYKWQVFMLQFIKGSWHYGEMDGIKLLDRYVTMEQMGKGFYKIIDDDIPEEEHKKAAANALERARAAFHCGKYKLVILDEINNAIDLGLISAVDVVRLLKEKPAGLNVILTGRGATSEIIEMAHLVTEMKEIKHPFRQGFKAKRGIDF